MFHSEMNKPNNNYTMNTKQIHKNWNQERKHN